MRADPSTLNQASVFWKTGRALEAGQIIFENVPIGARPKWAQTVLEHVVRRTNYNIDPILQILRVAKNQAEWGDAHRVFSTIRKYTLRIDEIKTRTLEDRLFLAQLCLAENVAKVIYNATNPSDPFDSDSGWWIAACLKDILDLVGDRDFATSIWTVLVAPLENEPTHQP